MKLEKPFDTFKIERHAGEYKDFGITDSSYPLKGVTYPVDYGEIDGFTIEDGAKLDLFVGQKGVLMGFIRVVRPELPEGESKFYINLTDDEESKVLKEFSPVILEQGRFESIDELRAAIEPYRDKS